MLPKPEKARRADGIMSGARSDVKQRRLGTTNLELSVVGFGAWAAGGAGWLHGLGPQADSDSIAAIRRAVEGGVNWIDTAPLYGIGHSEEVVGAALRTPPRADRPYVFTKCSAAWTADGDIEEWATPESIRRQLDDSLRRLGIEQVDLLQIHAPRFYGDALDEAWAVLLDLKATGKTRYAGVSNFTVEQLRACEKVGRIDSLQPEFSAIKRAAATDLIPWCAVNGTGVIVYSPMQSGLLSGAYTEAHVAALPDIDVRKRGRSEFAQPNLTRNVALGRSLGELAQRLGAPTPAVAVAWTLAWPGVTGAIVGARRPDQVDDWLMAGELELGPAELDVVAEAIAATEAGAGPSRPTRAV
jgi:aryl-alcohol dehydrogenase-like predicted oxidoreductase